MEKKLNKSFWDEKYSTFDASEKVEGDLFLANKNIDLKNKKILIVAVGTGKEVVRAARMGAEVYGIDISSNAAKNAEEMLKANNLTGSMKVGDGAATNFENNFFDVIWGSAVLHHLDHQKFSEELNRIIKPGGSIIFVDEPTFFNPLIKFSYETLYGKGFENRRRKFLFFTRTGDDLEKPIDESDLLFYEKYFITEKKPHDFMLIEKIAHAIFGHRNIVQKTFRSIDLFLVKIMPFLKKYGYEYNFIFHEKKKIN
jgi:ubiquinone/menaquinone biosynthesis C-methylase UbiE